MPLRTSKLWLALTPSRKQTHQQDSLASEPPQHSSRLTIGNGLLPVELLQQIFMHLDFLTLLCCRHVSRLWAHSLPSQFTSRHATFHPRFSRVHGPTQPNLRFQITFNINVSRHFQHDAAHIVCAAILCLDTQPPSPVSTLFVNPLIGTLNQTVIYEHRRQGMFVPLFPQLSRRPAFPWSGLNPESWKCMTLSCPPVGSARVVCVFRCSQLGRNRESRKQREVSHAGDIRVGRVVGEVEEMIAWMLKEWFY